MADRDPNESRRAPANEPDWLTLGQAAKYLGVAQSTIRKWSDQERLKAFYTPGVTGAIGSGTSTHSWSARAAGAQPQTEARSC